MTKKHGACVINFLKKTNREQAPKSSQNSVKHFRHNSKLVNLTRKTCQRVRTQILSCFVPGKHFLYTLEPLLWPMKSRKQCGLQRKTLHRGCTKLNHTSLSEEHWLHILRHLAFARFYEILSFTYQVIVAWTCRPRWFYLRSRKITANCILQMSRCP